MTLDEDMRNRLQTLEQTMLRRRIPRVTDRQGPHYTLDGRPVLGFCSNDYLGFADEPLTSTDLVDAPTGSTGSRLISGDTRQLRRFEEDLAHHLGAPAALLFPSGYQANVSCIPALLRSHDLVYSDAANHASLIDGLRLAAAQRRILPHLTPPTCETPTADTPGIDPTVWWVLESRFSMDGDAPDPAQLDAFATGGGALYLDEAHTFGLYDAGRGWADHHAVKPPVRVITFGKALGFAGAAVLASPHVIDWLHNRARGFVFSTAPSPAVVTLLRRRFERLIGPDGDHRRAALRTNIAHLGDRLDCDLPLDAPIVPIVVGDNDRALAASRALLDRGLHVQAIRPPTVPPGSARLRITLSAHHRIEHIDALANAMIDLALAPAQPPHRRPGSHAP